MTKENLPAVPHSNVPAFSVSNNFTVNDVLSVAVGAAESKLQKILKAGMDNIKKIEKRIKDIGKDLDIQVEALRVECGLKADIDAANEIMGRLFGVTVATGVHMDMKGKQVHYQYACVHSNSHKKVPFNTEITRLVDLLECEQETLENARADVSETRKRLANIPALERRYRGKLVASQLEKTAEGKSVLATITANMEEELANM